jgi:hypothetical protein
MRKGRLSSSLNTGTTTEIIGFWFITLFAGNRRATVLAMTGSYRHAFWRPVLRRRNVFGAGMWHERDARQITD